MPLSFHVTPKHQIIAGAGILAVLAGVGVTVIDYPPHMDFPARWLRSAPSAASVSSTPAAAAPASPAAKPPRRARTAAKRQDHGKSAKTAVRPPPRAARTAKPPSIDAQYDDAVRRECSGGALGILCREKIKWRVCNGRWNGGGIPGETRCRVEKDGAAAG